MVKEPTVISTFAGTGGSSLGYKWAGYKELLAIEWEDHAVECFKLNFPEVPVWQKDITKVTSQEILEFCNLKVGELDVFDGSPPCQGFSTAGKREVTDPRNDLFQHYWRLVKELQPKVFVMENVSGMVKGTMKGKFIEIMNTLKSDNYNVKCKLMNSMYYGVPQSRQRTVFIGVRKDLNKEPSYPIPSNKIIPIKEVIDDYRIAHVNAQFDNKMRSVYRPAHTVTKTASMEFKNRDGSISKPRIEELLAICSFPKDWKMGGSYGQKYARLGNAVMPKFMQHIALCIKENILS
jgi:DNA (cytosine-5)-methyltransferase 1